jgi:hypothetical protein
MNIEDEARTEALVFLERARRTTADLTPERIAVAAFFAGAAWGVGKAGDISKEHLGDLLKP